MFGIPTYPTSRGIASILWYKMLICLGNLLSYSLAVNIFHSSTFGVLYIPVVPEQLSSTVLGFTLALR